MDNRTVTRKATKSEANFKPDKWQAKRPQVTLRNVAKMIVAGLPLEDEGFGAQVNLTLDVLKRLKRGHKIALEVAYIFSRKCPQQERGDVFQELSLKLIEHGALTMGLAYAVARCDWADWWRRYSIRQHLSLDMSALDEDGNTVQFSDLLVGEVEFEAKVIAEMDARALYNSLPPDIRGIVSKRLIGKPTTNTERSKLKRYIAQRPVALANYV